MNQTTLNRGLRAEQLAKEYLTQQGLKPITQNYRCRLGEIDLIMSDITHLIFVEVRMRLNPNCGGPLDSISLTKQQRLIKTAIHYLQKNSLYDKTPCRFDVIGIDQKKTFTWIKNAIF